MTNIRLGIDFDNTLVCYDGAFHRVALEQGLIPAELPVSKSAVRDYLRAAGKEDRWTEMQGYVYGPRLGDAQAFPDALDMVAKLTRLCESVFIVSHKTRHPYLGPAYDLHEAALNWLEKNGFHDLTRLALPRENVFLELTKQAKLERIGLLNCTHFIDDLPELLAEASFPKDTTKVLFDPKQEHTPTVPMQRLLAWSDLPSLLGLSK